MIPHRLRHMQIFISYSHQDAALLKRLRVHLKPLERDFGADIWDDTRIQSGAKWQEEIGRALESAAVAILLVSADFLASDFIAGNELPPLLKAAEEEGTLILPVILSPSGFKRHEALSQFQAFNDPSKPLLNMPRGGQEAVFEKVAERVAELLGTLGSAAQKEVKAGRAGKAKQTTDRKQTMGLAADLARSQKGDGPINDYSSKQTDTSDREPSNAQKGRRRGHWLVIAASGLMVLLAVSIVIAIKQSGDRAEGMTPVNKPSLARLDNLPPPGPGQSPPSPIKVTIEKGRVAKVFDERLLIYLDRIRFDEGANQYLISFHISSANFRELGFRDAQASSVRQYTYLADNKFKIQLLSAEENSAYFSIEETVN